MEDLMWSDYLKLAVHMQIFFFFFKVFMHIKLVLLECQITVDNRFKQGYPGLGL